MNDNASRNARALRWFAAAGCAALLAGCAAVYSPVPMGEEPMAIDAEQWDGLWTAPDIGLVVKTVDAEQGLLDVLMIDGTTTQSSLVQLMRSGGWVFASVRVEEEPDTDEPLPSPPEGADATDEGTAGPDDESGLVIADAKPWAFLRVVNKEDTLVIWMPHADRFRRAIERGHLPGRIAEEEAGDPVYLGTLTADHYRLITESTEGVLMDWDEPVVLVRSGR